MAPYKDLLNRYFGEPGTPERVEYDYKYRREVNQLLLGRILRKIKASLRR